MENKFYFVNLSLKLSCNQKVAYVRPVYLLSPHDVLNDWQFKGLSCNQFCKNENHDKHISLYQQVIYNILDLISELEVINCSDRDISYWRKYFKITTFIKIVSVYFFLNIYLGKVLFKHYTQRLLSPCKK